MSTFSITNGNSILELVKGEAGYGLKLYSYECLARKQLVACSDRPAGVFYGDNANLHICRQGFDEVSHECGFINARKTFSDIQRNTWSITLKIGTYENFGFSAEFKWKLLEGAAGDVFFIHPLEVMMDDLDTYTLMPGMLYDGNAFSDRIKDIPRLYPGKENVLDVPTVSLAAPVFGLYGKSSGKALFYAATQGTALGNSGFSYRKYSGDCRPEVAIIAPCYRNSRYRHCRFEEYEAKGAVVKEGDEIDIPVLYVPSMSCSIPEFFQSLHKIRSFTRGEAKRKNVLPVSAAARLVEQNMNNHHWYNDLFYCNALGPDGVIGDIHKGFPRDWMLQTGWCAGVMTGYGLISVGNELSGRRARKMIDFICDRGISPSGLFYSMYDGERWDDDTLYDGGYRHIRPSADAAFYLIRSINIEKRNGIEHENWRKAAVKNLNAFVKLWKEHCDFGHFIDRTKGVVIEGGSAAGALCIACLALGWEMTGNRAYLDVAAEAAQSYYEKYVETGHMNGGPIDILMAADSESVCAMLESFVCLYEQAKDPQHLQYAEVAADIFASWVMSYNGKFPQGSTLDKLGIQTLGGIIANAQNHHIGPSTATNSISFLFRLYRYTGKQTYLRLLEDISTCLSQYVCRYDGHIGALKAGMMTEQINLADALNDSGEIWDVSASWSQNNVLLTYAEVPGIYVDFARRITGVFDHVGAMTDYEDRKITITNETEYACKIHVLVEGRGESIVELQPHGLKELCC